MGIILHEYRDGTTLTRAKNWDNWLILLKKADQNKILWAKQEAVKDEHYFQGVRDLALTYGRYKVYFDFVSLYDETTSNVDENVFDYIIPHIARSYRPEDWFNVEVLFGTLYATMLAEQNRPLPLKKRIKRLAVHQLLIFNYHVHYVARFSKKQNLHNIKIVTHNEVCLNSQNGELCNNADQCVHVVNEPPSYFLNLLCELYGF